MTATTGLNADPRRCGPARLRGALARNRLCPAIAGFTLLELILVMVIICTVLAMAAPSLRGFFASRQTADAAAQIVALTQWARSQAVAEGRTYRLNFDVEAGTYWLTSQEGGAFRPLQCEFGRVFSLPEGTRIRWDGTSEDLSHTRILFYPNGRTQETAVRLTGHQGEVVEIACPSPTEPFRVIMPSEGEG